MAYPMGYEMRDPVRRLVNEPMSLLGVSSEIEAGREIVLGREFSFEHA